MRALLALTLLVRVAHALPGEERALKLTTPGPDAGAINVKLQVVALTSGARHPVAPGDTLRTGDRVELLVECDKAAYVYVAQVFADGSAAVLFPQDQKDFQIYSGVQTRIPAGDQWFELDEHTGDEHVVVVASKRPIAEADKEARRVLDEIKKPASPGARAKKKPAVLSLRTRGLVLVSGDKPGMSARTDASGVAIFRFSFKHAK